MGASGEIFRAKKRGKEHMKEQQKKKAAPVLVVLILIVLVGAAGVGSFLINRYKPGTEYMAGNEYFNLTDENFWKSRPSLSEESRMRRTHM